MKKIIIAIIIIILCLLFAIFYYIQSVGFIDDWDDIYLEQEKVEDGWIVTVTYVDVAWVDDVGFTFDQLNYRLNWTESSPFIDIVEKYDNTSTIIFHDNNNDNLLSVNDTFEIKNDTQIMKSGSQFHILVLTSSESFGIGLK